MNIIHAKFHFIGIGGIGMCGLAELLHGMGAKVTGSDLSENANVKRLKDLGISICMGHKAESVDQADVVVFSSAVPQDNPELVEAKKRKIPIIRRAEALAEILRLKRSVCIAGTHGKTTTTSLMASMMIDADLDPTIIVGGKLQSLGTTAKLGQGAWGVAEADESDGSFSKLSPVIAVITNIDRDHMDFYKSQQVLEKAFRDFAEKIPFYGRLVICGDDDRTFELFQDFPKPMSTYGFHSRNEYRLEKEGHKYKIFHGDQFVEEFCLSMPGRHNALNALAGFIVGREIGLEDQVAVRGLEGFSGVGRRFELKAVIDGVDYFDDYAHHPTELKAVLSAFKERFPDRRIVALFQPHRFSRTQDLWKDFMTSFQDADQVYISDIYPAGESPLPGISSEQLATEIGDKKVRYFGELSQPNLMGLKAELKAGDVLVTLGAGSISKLAEVLHK
ncbi:MAG: UDP-N-acetylmuramate--L-alanine ligase [Bdellovibrionaceae bacterium]|nr:UDP-N-acetylmuramate--L-alanine ligase [Pseudobdellovibrionaceae bacterium]